MKACDHCGQFTVVTFVIESKGKPDLHACRQCWSATPAGSDNPSSAPGRKMSKRK